MWIRQCLKLKGDMMDPVFIKMETYMDVMDILTLARDKIQEAAKLLMQIEELKSEEEKKFSEWKDNLETIKARIMAIAEMLPTAGV